MWNEDVDCAQAGQAVGGINSVLPAAALVKSMMEELATCLQKLGKFGNQVPDNPKFDVGEIPDAIPLTLSSL